MPKSLELRYCLVSCAISVFLSNPLSASITAAANLHQTQLRRWKLNGSVKFDAYPKTLGQVFPMSMNLCQTIVL